MNLLQDSFSFVQTVYSNCVSSNSKSLFDVHLKIKVKERIEY